MNRKILLIVINTMFITPLLSQTAEISDSLKSNIQSLIEANDFKGIVIGTLSGEEINYYSKGVRSTEKNEAVDENTVFEIGSISKTFTGLLLAEMVIHDTLKLEDNIQKYLPKGIKAPMRDGKSMQLVQLSNHTSGLPRMPLNFNPADPLNPFKDYTTEKMYAFLDGYELPREIGSLYEYSNLAAGLLGHILAEARKTTYEELLKTIITEPLGMKHTGITQVNGPLSNGHMGGKEVPNWEFGALEGAGAIRSTASDMMMYLEANMGLTDSKLYPAMELAHKNSGTAESNPIVGLGWHTMVYDDKEIIWHNGGTGGFTSFMGWIKGTEEGVVVLNNSTENVDYVGLNVLVSSFPLKVIKKSVDLDEDILASYVGEYALAPTFILTISKEGNQLSAQATGQSALSIYPASENKFFFKLVDADLVFQKDQNGKVESATLFQGGQEILGKKLE